MKKSEITFKIELDNNNIPEKILWDATDKPDQGESETKSISISLWDHMQKNTLRIDLWSKDMPTNEMRRFYIDCIGGIAQSVLTSTGDEYMAEEINKFCSTLAAYVAKSEK